MALNALTLSVTSGVQGRRFLSAVSGQTAGNILEILPHGAPGFGVSNGMVSNEGLPYDANLLRIRERNPITGENRTTEIIVTTTSQAAIQAQAAALVPGYKGYRIAPVAQGDGSLVWTLFVESIVGATTSTSIGNVSISGSPALATVGDSTPFNPTISGGTGPYTVTVASGALPAGRSLNSSTGAVTGTYTTAAAIAYTLRVTDSSSPTPQTADLPVSGQVYPVLGPTTASFQTSATAGTDIFTFTGLGVGETVASVVVTATGLSDNKVAIGGSGTKAVVGVTASSAGTISYTFTTNAGRQLAVSITASAVSPSAFTMSQQPKANRIYQRDTFTGGGQSKGQGSVDAPLSAVTQIGSVWARCSSGGGTRGDLQASWVAGTLSATGAQTITLTGVDARLGWFYLDLSQDGATWQNGTVLIGMGDLIAFGASQSMAVALISRYDSTNTLASLGITPNDNGRVFLTWDGKLTSPASSIVWEQVVDTTGADKVNSAGMVKLLDWSIQMRGINVGVIGHVFGGQPVSIWNNLSGTDTTDMTRLKAVLAAAGNKFSEIFTAIGHADAQIPTPAATFKARWKAAIDQMKGVNTLPGGTRAVYASTIPFRQGVYGGRTNDNNIRQAGAELCAAEGWAHLPAPDLKLNADQTHPDMVGAQRYALHIVRASRPVIGLAGDHRGPSVSSITRASTPGGQMTVNLTMQPGATALSASGSPVNRFFASEPGDLSQPWDIGAPTLGSSSFTMLDSDPTSPIDFWFAENFTAASLDGSTDMIYDNHIEPDETAMGITVGRPLTPPMAGFAAAAKPGLNLVYNATIGSPTYEAADSGFGQRLIGSAGSVNVPLPMLWTITCRVRQASPSGAIATFASNGQTGSLGIAADGTARAQAAFSTLTTAIQIADGNVHTLALVRTMTQYLFFVDGVLAYTQNDNATSALDYGKVRTVGLRMFYSAGQQLPGAGAAVDEISFWRGSKYTATYTPPSAPFVGNEANLIALFHLDGNANDSCTN